MPYLAIASEHPSFQKFPISKSVRGDELVRTTFVCNFDYYLFRDMSKAEQISRNSIGQICMAANKIANAGSRSAPL